MKKTLIKLYYFLLIVGTLAMVGRTIVTGSQAVMAGQRVAELQKQQKALAQQQRELQQATSQELAIDAISTLAQTQGYAPITQVAVAHQHSEQVASR